MFGFIFAGCCSLVGSVLNKMSVVTMNGTFYIVGMLVFSIVVADACFLVYSKRMISKLRMVVKGCLLAGATMNPLYLISLSVMADIVLLVIEYNLIKEMYVCPQSWLAMNIFALLAFISFFFVPDSLFTLALTMFMIAMIIPLELYMTYHEVNTKS